jgi:hypothetical protein
MSFEMIATTQEDAADTLGITSRQLRRWITSGCPGGQRSYPIREMIAWARANVWSVDTAILAGAPADVRAEYLRARVEKLRKENTLADFKIHGRSDELVNLDGVRAMILEGCRRLRAGLTRLDSEAASLVSETLDEIEQSNWGEYLR